jgi:hypothetical protein
MSVIDSPIPRFHLACRSTYLAAAGEFYGEVFAA